eukprot:595140-Amphidinium_carterae.1
MMRTVGGLEPFPLGWLSGGMAPEVARGRGGLRFGTNVPCGAEFELPDPTKLVHAMHLAHALPKCGLDCKLQQVAIC